MDNTYRKTAANLLKARKTFSPDGMDPEYICDGDGEDVCKAMVSRGSIVGDKEEMAALIAFVLNDYAEAFGD